MQADAQVVAVTVKAVVRAANDVTFVETVSHSLYHFDKTLGKNLKFCDFSPEFSIL